ncbi:hypothetical protein Smp_137200 [Schistosoma mansoni]|uniref:hypothetical protein n=1 Tax=Schistosoma mansoni TaxID=6183 RepID=UPI00022C8498|nr:hypothetical protein Smp_137200 [Schistosoma mansoni]|eukprot:XP_018646914.1 hypothetical protein Smp_137200 [Schistosoma mansoni]
MFLNKLLDYNGFASVPFTNEKAKVNSLHYFDFYGCYFSCCDHKFHNKPEIEDDEMVIARQTTNNLEVPTDFWNFFERFCKHINVSKMSMNSPTYSNIQRHLTSEVERREFMNNGNNIYFCSYCIRNYMLKASIKYDMNTEQYLNLFLFRKFSLRSPRSIIKTKDKMSSFNKTGNMIPTFTLPAVNSVPVRAVSIHSSNLLPSSSGNIINDFNQVTFPHYQFNVVQIKYGIIQIKVDDDRATWKQTTTFSGLQVIEQKVRYISLVAQPESMQIAFNDRIHIACFRNLEKSNIMRLVLPVNFIRIHISITVNRPLLIYVSTVNDKINPHLIGMEGRTARLDSRYLEVRAEPWEKDSLIWFTVTKIPMHGHLFLVNRSSQQTNTNKELDDKIYLGVSSKFTQEDLRAGNLFYTFRRVLDDSLERTSDVSSKRFSLMDEFKYRVNVEGAQPKTIYDFRIVINKISSATSISTNKFSPTIINRGGIVEEGGDLILTPELFYAKHSQCQNNSVQKSSDDLFQDYDLYFQILSLPEHGTLLIKSPYNSTLTNLINLTEYNHKLISHNLLIYRHNGEEEFKDSFQFQFFCRQTPISHSYDDTNDDITVHLTGLTHTSVDELFGQPVTSVFRIRIIPVNDNPPNLYITPLFVEFNKTNNTLSKSFKIIDKDKNLQNDYFDNNDNDNELIYKRGDFWIYWEENKNFQRKDIIYPSLGYFIQNLDMTVSRRFKYSELTNGLINFKHMGLPTGQVNLKVMDGKFTVTKLLTINATKPSLLVLQPSRITLRPNGRVFIPIEVITNVHLDPSDIQINVIRSGCFGNLVLFGLTDQSTNWTYNDLLQFPLYYEYISSWSQSKLQNITSFKSTARSLYCKLLYSNSKNDKKDDFLTLRSDEVYLFVSTTFSGHILQQEVRLSILLSQLKLWDDGNINGGNDVKFTSDELTVETGKSVVVQPNFFPNNNDTRSFSQIPIIVNQHWNLALDAKNYRSLTDSKLTPILNKENPVRHDEPFIATNEGSFSLTSKNTEYDMTQLSESILELDAPYAQNKYSTSSNRDPKKNVKTLYTVKNGPSYGLIISKKLNRTVRLFSDVDLATNDIYYQNFGNTSISEDSVDLQVLELTTKTMTVNPVKIKFTLNEMNSRPYLKTCRPMRILTGSSVVIHTDYLNAALTSGFNSDQITYEILYTHQGHVVFLNSFSVSLSTFTQMDLRQGRVGFVHSGSQKGTACGFAFVLIYNLYRSDIYQFQIIPGTVELNVISNRTLLVFPKGFEIITPHHISTQIKFSTLKSMDYESHSTALKNNNLSNTSSSLPCLMPRQCQLENELGLYVVYKVLSQPTYGSIVRFSVTDRSHLAIWNDSINEFTQLKIARPPEHGTLWLGSKRMETGSIIPGLLSGELVEKLIYRHDGSLTKKDSFELLVYQLNRSLTSYEQPISFPIQIVPNLNTSLKLIYPVNQINKNNLLSRSKTLITVEMNDYVTITNEHLYVQHEFIQPQFIYIHFKTLPKYGKLYYSYNSFKQEHDMLTPECETLYKITQNDVNLKRLRYFANNVDGSKEDPNIAVYDSATFEIYQNEYPNLQMNKLSGVLQFQIILSNVVLNNSVQLSLLQNETKLWLDAEMLQVQSSRWKNYQHDYQTNLFTFFHIKQIPSYGRVFVDTIPVHRFSYTQLEQNRVYYEKTNFSTPHDSFTIEIKKFVCGMSLRTRSNILDWLPNELSGEHSSYMTFTVNITVQSLISFDTLYVSPGKMTKIDPQNLEISKFHELLHKYNIPNQMPTKNNRKVTSITMFTFPTGTMLQSGRFYINNRLVISSGYLNDKLTSSIGISLQDFLSNNVYFEAYQIPNEGIEIYEETIPYIFTLGTFFTPQMYFTTSDPIFVQPGYGDLKISIKNFLFSTTANNNFNINDSISRSVSISSPSVVSSTSKIDMINNISRYSGTGRIAFTIAGLALSLAFISVVIICSIGCCIYKRKNKTSKSILGMSNQSEEKVSTSFPLTMTTLTRETVNSPNKYILKSNHDSIELCSFHEINESGKLHSDEGVNNLTLSNQPSRVTFNNKVDINRIISVEPSVQSVQDFSCSCDFSGAVVYWTTDMEASTSVPAISCQNDNNFSNYGNYYSNHAFHLISTNDKIISQPPTLSSSLSSNILPTQQHTAQFSSPVLLAQLPATSLNLPHLTLLSPSEAANQINMNIVPLESQFLNASKVENEKTKVENVQLSSEIFDHDNLKCVDKVIESRCDDFLFNESQKCNSINTPLICIQNNVYGKHFDISLMNEQI